ERECFYKEFEEYIDGFSQRLYVLPGLSGLAQINDRYIFTPEQKIPFDIEYIDNRSFWLDIKIIFMTPKMIFVSKGEK
ncbi:MAG: sugar transferase, partial [Clostridia bacterium]|nr:sugar transferase [Clostridia bacterium]